ncbi:MAG: single-stranded DNA-binding protein, partial [Candidatus Bathyarchaeia archaeon]
KPGLRNVNVTVKVVDIGEPRSVTSRRDVSVHRVAEALVGDETGCVLLTLWDDQVSAFNNGDVIEVKNGYTRLFRGFLRLNIGREGTAEKVGKEIGEVNTENNLSKERHESFRYRPARRPFRRRRRY